MTYTQHLESNTNKLNRQEIDTVLRRHYGSRSKVAHRLGVAETNIYTWLAGKTTSAPVARECEAMALELLELEEKTRAPIAA